MKKCVNKASHTRDMNLINTQTYQSSVLFKMFNKASQISNIDLVLQQSRQQYASLKIINQTYPLISEQIFNGVVNKQNEMVQSTGNKLYDFMYAIPSGNKYTTIQTNIHQFLNDVLFPDFMLYHIHMFNCIL